MDCFLFVAQELLQSQHSEKLKTPLNWKNKIQSRFHHLFVQKSNIY